MFSSAMSERNSCFFNEFNINLDKISNKIVKYNKNMFRFFDKIIEYEYELIFLNNSICNFSNTIFANFAVTFCHKNIISIVSAIDLIKKGYIGSAKIIFRNVYEGLLIGKFVSLTDSDRLYESWKNGEQISIKNEIFLRFKNKPSDETIEFWDFLNKYTHSTIYSQNVLFKFNADEVQECNSIISLLLEMNYHLLNTFVLKQSYYYLNFYYSDYYKTTKHNVRKLFKLSRKMIDPRCKVILKEYSADWELKGI